MAEVSSNQFLRVDQRFDNLQLELGAIRREINSLNNDIDRAFKAKTITEEETVALIAGQRRLDRWVDQIAKETGIKLSVN
jgi:seryl-tRNA synthetase